MRCTFSPVKITTCYQAKFESETNSADLRYFRHTIMLCYQVFVKKIMTKELFLRKVIILEDQDLKMAAFLFYGNHEAHQNWLDLSK